MAKKTTTKKINKNDACYKAIAQWYLKHPDGDDLAVNKFSRDTGFNKAIVSTQKKKYLSTLVAKNKEVIEKEANLESFVEMPSVEQCLIALNMQVPKTFDEQVEVIVKLKANNEFAREIVTQNLFSMFYQYTSKGNIDKIPESLLKLAPTLLKKV